jgi:predicted cobalt transporter CbtA
MRVDSRVVVGWCRVALHQLITNNQTYLHTRAQRALWGFGGFGVFGVFGALGLPIFFESNVSSFVRLLGESGFDHVIQTVVNVSF